MHKSTNDRRWRESIASAVFRMSRDMGEKLSGTAPRFVIIIGCQRSGTTLMGQIIGAHPRALLVDETDNVYEWTNLVFDSNDSCVNENQINELFERAKRKYCRTETRALRPDSIFVLQAPNLTCCPTQISSYFPGARVIYMLRDVRAIVSSMLRLSQIPFVDNQIRFFREAGFIVKDFPEEWGGLMDDGVSEAVKMALVAKIKMSLSGKFEAAGVPVLQVRYEDLVSKPRETVADVSRHIGIPLDERCLGHEDVFLGCGPGNTDRARAIDRLSLDRWSEELTSETLGSIWDEVGEFYEDLGYTRTSPEVNLS